MQFLAYNKALLFTLGWQLWPEYRSRSTVANFDFAKELVERGNEDHEAYRPASAMLRIRSARGQTAITKDRMDWRLSQDIWLYNGPLNGALRWLGFGPASASPALIVTPDSDVSTSQNKRLGPRTDQGLMLKFHVKFASAAYANLA